MKIVFVGLFMSLVIFVKGQMDVPETPTNECGKVNNSKWAFVWVMKIQSMLTRGVLAQGLFVTVNYVVSAFTPFLNVARKRKLLTFYRIITYRRLSNIYCHRKRKPIKFIPPMKWPFIEVKEVSNIALWLLEDIEPKEPGVWYPFAPAETLETLKEKTAGNIEVGSSCYIFQFNNNTDITRGDTQGIHFNLQNASSCEQAFCRENICNVSNRFTYCAVLDEERDETFLMGTPLFCGNAFAGVMGLIGRGPETKKRILLSGTFNIFELYQKWLHTLTITRGTRGPRPVKGTSDNMTDVESTLVAVTTEDNAMKGLTSRVNMPVVFSRETTETLFYKKIPTNAKTSNGNVLVAHPALYVIWAVVFYERCT